MAFALHWHGLLRTRGLLLVLLFLLLILLLLLLFLLILLRRGFLLLFFLLLLLLFHFFNQIINGFNNLNLLVQGLLLSIACAHLPLYILHLLADFCERVCLFAQVSY
ncbi:MAG: hypothetical protein COA78_09360 [Blastopirellula sp.]|nr:MAG: hypothetical protein COA78_09360 [Blastopirellula sp.]